MRSATRIAAAAALILLAACGSGATEAEPPLSEAPRREVAAADPTPMPAPTEAAATVTDCEPDAPQSPCPIAGRWRVLRTFAPSQSDPNDDELRMTGATFTVVANGDGPGSINWDGPDTGQFDIRDVCTGPFLTARAEARPDESRTTLGRALRAWSVAGADPSAARHLGCDDGAWATPSDASGEWYGLMLPLGRRLAFEWHDERFVLAERID